MLISELYSVDLELVEIREQLRGQEQNLEREELRLMDKVANDTSLPNQWSRDYATRKYKLDDKSYNLVLKGVNELTYNLRRNIARRTYLHNTIMASRKPEET
jgi:hypothetical protein